MPGAPQTTGMERALAVARDTATGRRLLREAGELTAGVDAELLVLAVVDEDDHRQTVQRGFGTRTGDVPSIDDLVASTEDSLSDLAAEELPDGLDYDLLARVGSLPDAVLDVADERDCDHVFVVGERRSPAGKALFGDVAQSVILEFDGPVTVALDEE